MADDLNTKSFEIHLTGGRTGKLWSGKFKTKVFLGFADRLRKDQLRADLLIQDEKTASIEAINIARMLAELKVRLVESPEWWTAAGDGAFLVDDEVLITVYNEALKVEEDAISKIQEDAKKVAPEVKKSTKKSDV